MILAVSRDAGHFRSPTRPISRDFGMIQSGPTRPRSDLWLFRPGWAHCSAPTSGYTRREWAALEVLLGRVSSAPQLSIAAEFLGPMPLAWGRPWSWKGTHSRSILRPGLSDKTFPCTISVVASLIRLFPDAYQHTSGAGAGTSGVSACPPC